MSKTGDPGPAPMDPLTLHTAARRWLTDRYAELTREYSTLPGAGRTEDGSYRPEALRVFPRYQVAAAVLFEVERLDPDSLPPLPALVDALVEAARAAESPFTRPDGDEVVAEAMAAERGLFRSTVHRWLAGGDLRAEPLPYRRVLAPAESAARDEQLRLRWGLADRIWHPLVAAPIPPDVLILVADAMWDEQGLARARHALREVGDRRVYELCEDRIDYLVDVELFAPR